MDIEQALCYSGDSQQHTSIVSIGRPQSNNAMDDRRWLTGNRLSSLKDESYDLFNSNSSWCTQSVSGLRTSTTMVLPLAVDESFRLRRSTRPGFRSPTDRASSALCSTSSATRITSFSWRSSSSICNFLGRPGETNVIQVWRTGERIGRRGELQLRTVVAINSPERWCFNLFPNRVLRNSNLRYNLSDLIHRNSLLARLRDSDVFDTEYRWGEQVWAD